MIFFLSLSSLLLFYHKSVLAANRIDTDYFAHLLFILIFVIIEGKGDIAMELVVLGLLLLFGLILVKRMLFRILFLGGFLLLLFWYLSAVTT